MADWDKMALMHIVIGFEAEILGIATYFTDPNTKWNHHIQGLLIVAFGLYVIGTGLLAATKLSGANVNIFVSLIVMVCMFVTGVFLVIGVGLNDTFNSSGPDGTYWTYALNGLAYSATLMMSAAFLAFLTLIFLLIHILTHGSRSVSSTPA